MAILDLQEDKVSDNRPRLLKFSQPESFFPRNRFTESFIFMSIIEIYVKNRFQQLFGSIIIPLTPEYIQYQLLLLSIYQMPPSVAR